MQFSSAIVDFYLFYDGTVDLTRSQWTASDTQVTVKAHGPPLYELLKDKPLYLNPKQGIYHTFYLSCYDLQDTHPVGVRGKVV